MINSLGGIADGAVCYTVDPKPTEPTEKPGFFARLFGKRPPRPRRYSPTNTSCARPPKWKLSAQNHHTEGYGRPGEPAPRRIYHLQAQGFGESACGFPHTLHPGYGLASSLMAILNGVDILDTNIWWFGGGSAAPRH